MRAVVKQHTGKGQVALVEISKPQPTDDEVLIAIKAVGLCGSDLHILHDLVPYDAPVVLGHEFAGVVVEIGSKVKDFAVGDQVIAENIDTGCGTCALCLTGHQCVCPQRNAKGINSDGAMTEYLVCKEKNLFKMPANISFEEAALMEPVTVCTHALLEQCEIIAGDVVLVSGPGSIGLIAAQVAQAAGAQVILVGTVTDTARLAVAKSLGIAHVVNLAEDDLRSLVAAQTGGIGVDVVVECAGAKQAVALGMDLLKQRGIYTQVGLLADAVTLDFNQIITKEMTIKGSLSHTSWAWQRAINLVASGAIRLKPLITHVFALEDWADAFQCMDAQQGIKIVLKP